MGSNPESGEAGLQPGAAPLPASESMAAVDGSNQEVIQALIDAFGVYTKTTEALEEAHRRLEERVQSLDRELENKNHQLALTTEHLNSILDSMSDGVIAVDTAGVITTFNQAAGRVLGYAADEVIGKSFRRVFGQEFIDAPGQQVREVPARKGKSIPVSERVSPICDSANVRLGTVKVFQDLSEIEALREQVRRKDRLAALGEMAATVAHEIRNPLGGIRGFASLLHRDIDAADPRARLVGKILQGAKNLDHVVNELLEYTRPVELSVKSSCCKPLVQDALGYLDLDGHAITVKNHVDAAVRVLADPGKIRQVIMNILLNAVQSIEGDGTITITSESDESRVTLRVRDTGCGIGKEEIAHLFSPFFTTKEKGTGLGLAVASKIVESHGGLLEVQSELGRGSEFLIRLPRGH